MFGRGYTTVKIKVVRLTIDCPRCGVRFRSIVQFRFHLGHSARWRNPASGSYSKLSLPGRSDTHDG